MKRTFLAVLSTVSLALLMLALPSASASALASTGPTAAIRVAHPTAAQLPSLAGSSPRTAGFHRLALVSCYSTSMRGVSGGQKGTWYYTLCYDTVRCAWEIVTAFFVPDPCRPGKPC